MGETGLSTSEIDLVIDLREVLTPRDVVRAAAVAGQVLQWAQGSGPWRSIAIASGAFPQSIARLPMQVASPVHRYDADLYDRVVAQNLDISLDYGDYCIWPPFQPDGGRQPRPNLRYAYGRDWQVYREGQAFQGYAPFYTLCRKVVHSPYWPGNGARYSAGDDEINRRAQPNATAGSGGPTQWMQWGASHHLAHIVDRLANLGGP